MIDPRIALGVQPLQIQSPMQGAQQMLTLRELMMGAQAQEARRDQLRMAQAHAAQQQAAHAVLNAKVTAEAAAKTVANLDEAQKMALLQAIQSQGVGSSAVVKGMA